MSHVIRPMLPALLGASLLAACSALPSASGTAALQDRDWVLVALGERSNPQGAGSKSLTLRLDTKTRRVAGFSGCNRYSAGYELAGSSIRFTAPISTRMACMDGMEVEQSFLASLPLVTSYTIVDKTLTLKMADNPVATFRAD